jgi:hypothetical protein
LKTKLVLTCETALHTTPKSITHFQTIVNRRARTRGHGQSVTSVELKIIFSRIEDATCLYMSRATTEMVIIAAIELGDDAVFLNQSIHL